ncbi:hypothetical protein [Faecalispora anaeroviscerum]|uniref:hypothetical protein n=1 Tax=Faecalispora anaeroviscerum TaxID=2991836 RepID=UPI0024BAD2A6|nr:hypothetical protein [Faecalispora anaeroviscerum]
MERLTTDNPQSNMESAHNIFSIKEGTTVCCLTEDSHEITLYDFMRHCAEVLHCSISYDDESDDDIGEFLTDQLFDGLNSPEGILAHFFTTAWAFSELRAKLKAYEDTGLSPEEVIQVNDFSHSQCARLLAENAKLKENQLDPLELAKVAIALKENATLKKALEQACIALVYPKKEMPQALYDRFIRMAQEQEKDNE